MHKKYFSSQSVAALSCSSVGFVFGTSDEFMVQESASFLEHLLFPLADQIVLNLLEQLL